MRISPKSLVMVSLILRKCWLRNVCLWEIGNILSSIECVQIDNCLIWYRIMWCCWDMIFLNTYLFDNFEINELFSMKLNVSEGLTYILSVLFVFNQFFSSLMMVQFQFYIELLLSSVKLSLCSLFVADDFLHNAG